MRYIYYIIIMLLIMSAIITYKLRQNTISEKEMALIINDRVITVAEFNRLYSAQPSYLKDKEEFIDFLITKELLIQESQKEGIDKEESFRNAIQNFYEQSLLKLLMDKKYSSLTVSVNEDELNRYLNFLNKRIHLTIFKFDSRKEAMKGPYRDGERKTVNFEDLSNDIQYGILTLEEGISDPIKSGEDFIVMKIDKVEVVSARSFSDTEKEKFKEMLLREKRENLINVWVADLRSKASISILINRDKQGD